MNPAKDTRLLHATVVCLAEQGFQVPSKVLAARAGIPEPTLFRTFPTKAALLAATYPYVLAQLTAPLAGQGPQPGERLCAVLARWWTLTAAAALAAPAVFACWRLWRGSARAVPGLPYGPFAAARPLLHRALGPRSPHPTGRLPARAVVPLLAAHWAGSVELALGTAEADRAALLGGLFASWWASTGWPAELPAEPAPASLSGIARLVQQYEPAGAPAATGNF